ncbi:MAG: YggS family pyridoxal phosphate-dependent enzyme [Patescibacteria group bacterium]
MSNISINLAKFQTELAAVCAKSGRDRSGITVVAVTKNRSPAEINELLENGIAAIGENRLQEFLAKKDELGAAEKHFIGRIQSNKAREIAREFDVVESVSSLKIAEILNDARRDVARNVSPTSQNPLPIFLQVNLAREPQKDGFLAEDLAAAIAEIAEFENLKIVGLMTIGLLENENRTREIFLEGKKLCDEFGLAKLSAGMSDDWKIAVACGATELRIGRMLFE